MTSVNYLETPTGYKHEVERRQVEDLTNELAHEVSSYTRRLRSAVREAEAMLMQLGSTGIASAGLAECGNLGVETRQTAIATEHV